jgi:hypothetical protein
MGGRTVVSAAEKRITLVRSFIVVNWGDVPTWLLVGLGALGGGAALWQLQLQRVQLRDQQNVLARQTRIQERQQADMIDVSARPTDGARATVLPEDKGEPVHMVVVRNGSARPIREVASKIEAIGADPSVRHEKMADLYGELMPQQRRVLSGNEVVQAEEFRLGERTHTMPVLRAGRTASFVWGFTIARYPRFLSWVRFTDDAGLHWEIDTSLHLTRLDKRDW